MECWVVPEYLDAVDRLDEDNDRRGDGRRCSVEPVIGGSTLVPVRLTARVTSGVLALMDLLHVAWASGSSLPFRSRRDLADVVVGSTAVPPPAARTKISRKRRSRR